MLLTKLNARRPQAHGRHQMLRLQMFEAAHTDQELAIEPAVAVGFSSNERMSDTLKHHGHIAGLALWAQRGVACSP